MRQPAALHVPERPATPELPKSGHQDKTTELSRTMEQHAVKEQAAEQGRAQPRPAPPGKCFSPPDLENLRRQRPLLRRQVAELAEADQQVHRPGQRHLHVGWGPAGAVVGARPQGPGPAVPVAPDASPPAGAPSAPPPPALHRRMLFFPAWSRRSAYSFTCRRRPMRSRQSRKKVLPCPTASPLSASPLCPQARTCTFTGKSRCSSKRCMKAAARPTCLLAVPITWGRE